MGSARKLKGRGFPRLKMDDEHQVTVRFRGSHLRFIQTSQVFDISETGMAFLCSKGLAPRVGDVIKLEVAPFSALQMACLGRVVRIEEPGDRSKWAEFPNTVKVGVEFQRLPRGYRFALARSLKDSFKDAKKPYKDKPINVGPVITWSIDWRFVGAIFGAITVFIASGFFLYWVVTMIQSNHSTVSAPWASGFFEKVINKDDH